MADRWSERAGRWGDQVLPAQRPETLCQRWVPKQTKMLFAALEMSSRGTDIMWELGVGWMEKGKGKKKLGQR